jgi:uncharacterized DUF497 family protein
MRFEWDPVKNASNIKKHGISFDEAIYVFTDKNALSILDEDNIIEEDRWITLGTIPEGKTLVVVHTERSNDCIRIISARKATKNEIKQYYVLSR